MDDIVTRYDFTESVIKAVSKRPVIYTKSMPDYNDKAKKVEAWEEVCRDVYPQWKGMTYEERSTRGNDVQLKWTNLRNCFLREVRNRRKAVSVAAERRRKTYIYYKHLTFLLPTIETKETETIEDSVSEEAEGNTTHNASNTTIPRRKKRKGAVSAEAEDINFMQYLKEYSDDPETYSNPPPPSPPSMSMSKHTVVSHEEEPEMADDDGDDDGDDDTHSEDNTFNNTPRSRGIKRRQSHSTTSMELTLLEYLRARDEREEELCEDKAFLMSLIPPLRRIPTEFKFEAKIEIMRVFSRYQQIKPSSRETTTHSPPPHPSHPPPHPSIVNGYNSNATPASSASPFPPPSTSLHR